MDYFHMLSPKSSGVMVYFSRTGCRTLANKQQISKAGYGFCRKLELNRQGSSCELGAPPVTGHRVS